MLYLILILFFLFLFYIYRSASNIKPPKVADKNILKSKLKTDGGRIYFKNSFMQKNKFGFHEVYAEGDPFERGVAMGKVCQKIKYAHEKNFIDSIHQIVPNRIYLNFLRLFIGVFNRNLHHFFKKEYLQELYGLSFSSSEDFNYIAPTYQRVLNYHAAHDIGHALQNIGLVGCSSFVVKDSRSKDKELVLARNLDFSPSEAFNEIKALYFINPAEGNRFVSYSWPGFIGVVSGMNEYGLAIVLHAAKSKMRFSIGTPVSIIAREILQYAKNIEQARKILKAKTSFVSELFLVVSAQDRSAVVFEKEPKSLTEYKMENDELLCLNHLQSKKRKEEAENQKWKHTISSAYREERLKELLAREEFLNPEIAAQILRDINGCKEENIGLQNENAINQLAAHHGVIFKPESLQFWVSANPNVLGEMVAYDLKKAFEIASSHKKEDLFNEKETINKDPFLNSSEYDLFLVYKKTKKQVLAATKQKEVLSSEIIQKLIDSNPLLFLTHEIAGDYYLSRQEKTKAKNAFLQALKLNIPTTHEKNRIEKKCQKL